MKKKILFVLFMLIPMVSCKNNKPSFDSDFSSVITTLNDDNFAFNKLKKTESLYVFKMEDINLNIRAYYKAFEEQFRYVFVLSFDYISTNINDIRVAAMLKTDSKSFIGQIGFKNNKKNISSYEDVSTSTFKGLQIFLSPYEKNVSKARFYFECENKVGLFFEINDLMEYK